MRKAVLSPNPTLKAKQRFIVEGLTESNRIITRDNLSSELGVIERPDKTVVPAGRVSSGEFGITLDFADDRARSEYIKWHQMAIDRGAHSRIPDISNDVGSNALHHDTDQGAVIGIDSNYKKTAFVVYHRLYKSPSDPPIKVKLTGCWVKSVEFPDFDIDAEETCELSCTISYDDIEIID